MRCSPVLVTGACGLVGSALVERLAGRGRYVVPTDLDTPANRATARRLARSCAVEFRWADLTDRATVNDLVSTIRPEAIVHLAAVIPPLCYARRDVARAVNVDATGSLVAAAAALSEPPRFVQASSVAVYGARNPHHHTDILTASTPVCPCDLYGGHKVEAEGAVISSGLPWVVLRLGGVLTSQIPRGASSDMLYFEGLLPTDGRLQTVDVRDVACAFDAATTTKATNEVFLVGGDESHRVTAGRLGPGLSWAMGLVDVLPPGRIGDPEDDAAWFTTDFMDTRRAQEVLRFQRRSLDDVLTEVREKVGPLRIGLRAVSPLIRALLRRRAPYREVPGKYADPWGRIRNRWGPPEADPIADESTTGARWRGFGHGEPSPLG